MVAHGRVELLAHPLSQKYLQMKWNSYGKYFHLTNLLFYCIFLTFVTTYTYLLMMQSSKSVNVETSTNKCGSQNVSQINSAHVVSADRNQNTTARG